jgi:hypothetical protein
LRRLPGPERLYQFVRQKDEALITRLRLIDP